MTTHTRTTIGCLFVVLCAAACGGGGKDYDTVGDVLVEIGEALCDRAIECGLITTGDRDTCESQFQQGACGATNCGADFEGDTGDVDDCIDELGDFDCAALDEGGVPSRCLSLS